jgi:hypothetical protein
MAERSRVRDEPSEQFPNWDEVWGEMSLLADETKVEGREPGERSDSRQPFGRCCAA